MPATYSITEPHPTYPQYTHSGRGGAGNFFKTPKTTQGTARALPALVSSTANPSSKFSSGRGGAGNIRLSSEKAVFSFDEELARQTSRERIMKETGAVWHVGRGGAGNWTTSARPSGGRKDSSSSTDSETSARTSGFFGRLSQTFERR